MTADFSFSTLLRNLDEGTAPVRVPASPTQAHMREVMEAYVENIGVSSPEFAAKYMAEDITGEDPVGAMRPSGDGAAESFAQAIEQLIDVPFTPKTAELISPISFSMKNKAAMAFKFWAEVDGRNISIDIVDVMTFDESGKICDIRAYWGPDNVTLLD